MLGTKVFKKFQPDLDEMKQENYTVSKNTSDVEKELSIKQRSNIKSVDKTNSLKIAISLSNYKEVG